MNSSDRLATCRGLLRDACVDSRIRLRAGCRSVDSDDPQAVRKDDPSVEQIGLSAVDAGEQRLEAEPAGEVAPDLGAGGLAISGSVRIGVSAAASAISWA